MIELRYKDGVTYDTHDGEEIFKLLNDEVQDIVIVNHTIIQTFHQVISGNEVSINRSAHTISISGTNGIISYIFLYQKIRYMITFEKDKVEKRLKMTISTVEMENELVV